MNTEFETNFVVMPTDTNYLYPLIFGGAFFAKMDLCAACTVSRVLHKSKTCTAAVTHKANVTWLKPCYAGDIVFLKGKVVELDQKSIVVDVTADREKRGSPERDHVGDGTFVFASIVSADNIGDRPDRLPCERHGLTMETT